MHKVQDHTKPRSVTISKTLLICSMFMVLSMFQGITSGLVHLDTTHDDLYGDGDPLRFTGTEVINDSVQLELLESNWTQGNWEAGPGHPIWANDQGFASGDGVEYNTTGQLELWPRYGNWRRMSSVPYDAIGQSIVWAKDRFILSGGLGSSGMSSMNYAYYMETDTWEIRKSMPSERFGHAAAFVDPYVYVMGDSSLMNSMLRYDLNLNSWSTLPNAPINRTEHTMVPTGDGDILVFGGKNETGNEVDELWNYNTSTGSWVQLSSAPKAMYGHSAAWDNGSHTMIVTGGRGSVGFMWDTYSYDPNTDQWSEIMHMPTSRIDHSMVYSPKDDRCVVFGGEGGGYLDDLFIYSYADDEWVDGVKGPTGRSGQGAAWGGGGMLVVGGKDQNGYLNETWFYNYTQNRTEGVLISSQIDLGVNADLIKFEFEYETPSGTTIEAQLASNTDHQTWEYLGPDGTTGSRFNVTTDFIIPDVHDGNRYFKYKLFLTTNDFNVSSKLKSVNLLYRYYQTPGSFISSIVDMGTDEAVIDMFSWVADMPSGTSVKMAVTSSPNSDMSDPSFKNRTIGNDVPILDNVSRYLKYEATLITMNAFYTPVLNEVRINYSAKPALSSGMVDPDAGTVETTFNYSIEFMDLDGRFPTLAEVVIDGINYDMVTSDLNTSDGALYKYSTKLGVGIHNHYYNFRVAAMNLRYPEQGSIPGPRVNFSNQDPVAVITLPKDKSVFEMGETIILKGDQSYDPDGDTLTYAWSSSLTGAITSEPDFNITLDLGIHILSLTVFDGNGGQDTSLVSVTVVTSVSNVGPVPKISEGEFVKEVGEEMLVDASHSYDPDGTIRSWTFDWGDGSPKDISGSGVATHRFSKAGKYNISVEIEDNNGLKNQTSFQVIIEKSTVPKPPPKNYTTSVNDPMFASVVVLIILISIIAAFEVARRSRF